MSIINQTLRELDARKGEAAPIPAPVFTSPPAPAGRRRPRVWLAAIALLPLAGVLAWLAWRAAVPPHETAAAPVPTVAAPAAAVPAQTVEPAPPAVAVAAAPPDTPAEPLAVAPPRPAAPQVEAEPAAHLAKTAERAAMVEAAPATTTAERPPLIRKEIRKPSAEEEADEQYRKAASLLQKGRENQVRPLLEEALRHNPAHLAARQMLALLLSEAGQTREAETVLIEGHRLAPDNTWFTLSLARLQAARGDEARAVATLKRGLEGRGVNADYHATLAGLQMRLGQHGEAAQHYQQALKQQPDQGTWWTGLGLSLAAQGKTEEARAAYQRAWASGQLPENLAEFIRGKLGE